MGIRAGWLRTFRYGGRSYAIHDGDIYRRCDSLVDLIAVLLTDELDMRRVIPTTSGIGWWVPLASGPRLEEIAAHFEGLMRKCSGAVVG